MIPPSPPAIVDDCSAVRHDSARGVTSSAVSTAVNAVLPPAVESVVGGSVSGAAAEGAADATVWTEVQAVLQNQSQTTIVGVRLGVKQDDGAYKIFDVPLTISPSYQAVAKERLVAGTAQIGVKQCSVLFVKFSDGTTWSAPPATPGP